MSEIVETILYTTPGQSESEQACRILEDKGVRVRVVDVRAARIEGFLVRDLGTDRTPIWITPEGVCSGLADIQARIAR
jgi:hypothetical protein